MSKQQIDHSRMNGSCPAWLLLVVLLAATALSYGCGRKAPPVPSKAIVPAAVDDLHAEIIGDSIRLRWSIPIQDESAIEGIKGFRLDYYKTENGDALCRGCPIPFRDSVFIRRESPAPAVIEEMQVTYWDWFEPGIHYAYKVVTFHRSGGVSADSNIVLVTPSQEE